ncbi:Arabinose 5-phosphate isomerase KdsD [Commensalibacter sp. Nvir]|uniref:KpsF/GutQ family sugar-phosphate isomerase n=1 Tax=Commensalibacter sp. Nvir TaxID=3069817 RepID=UPI002D68EB32|nr:Arabinose 5-phosphate isomerase KdsD [Commensalibacter sp. Nvir]
MTSFLHTTIQSACKTLSAEIKGIQDLIEALKKDSYLSTMFINAVNLLDNNKGRVILTGIGKSGHIAKKIQSTLASTGTPSFFVHPAEAAHGDLGMIQPGDIIIAISASGETEELSHIVAHTKRFDIKIIGITSNINSTLAKNATIPLVVPKSNEACPLGLAPTTSAIIQLAIGDALAVALLEKRNFTASDFGLYHPGGRLGSRLKIIRDLMHVKEEIPLGSENMPIHEAIMEMTRKALGCIGITTKDGSLIGLITDGDLRRTIDKDIRTLTAKDIMNRNPLIVDQDLLAAEALHLMNNRNHPVTCLFIVDKNRIPIGVIHIHDLLRAGIA